MSDIYRLKVSCSVSKLCELFGLTYNGTDREIRHVGRLDVVDSSVLTFANKNVALPPGSIVIAGADFEVQNDVEFTHIISDKPRVSFVVVLDYLVRAFGFENRGEQSRISDSAILGKNVVVGDGCEIGDRVIIEPNVTIHDGTVIGANSRIRSGASIGSDGFGFERLECGTPIRFPHLGRVVIGENVEIGSNTTIARGTLGDTVIDDHAKIDNLVHVAHNVHIKRGAFVTACAELSGGVVVGENAWIAPNVSTHQKLTIGANSLVGLGAVVVKDVPESTVVAGNPAKKLRELK
ncbi:UDP-3-O-(3-hydroxymyristoyl)glucosamine N-acyltransferase [Pseudidiomarina sediminum]|uniref:UDP-3-O-(3-hydroxymyristoyl)glucosamine N-acyltransferase n=1 Tax=Pseudidiomarina sediminum TaxID=431675 RepID=UPI001C97E241|nr:UDP-3-O-(3-hydroxymyristoyl)glucosamine N-acyltransferase [Pseudidiomarina sediminum]MBY6063708.1 hypothetical protein [Pseudidiomarina sediminum]